MTPNPEDPATITEYAAGVRRLARGLVRPDRVEDVVQETMLAFVRGPERARAGIGAWLGGVARNVARRMARTEGRRQRREAAAAARPPAPAPDEILARLDERAGVLRALRDLPEAYRSALWLRYFEDLPPRRIAKRLGAPVETVKSRLKRGLVQLRERLDADHGGRRSAWLGLLLPLARPGKLLVPAVGGIAMKKSILAVILLALLALLSGSAVLLLSGSSGRETAPLLPAEPTPVAAGTAAAEPAPAPAAPEAGPAEPVAAPPVEPVAEPGAEPGAGPDEEALLANSAPAFRRNPRAPPPPKPGQVQVGGGGGMGPTGGWSKFPPPRASGPATLVATVLDSKGVPVPGADVYLGPPDVAGEAAVSFGDLLLAGKTDAAGRLTRAGLPEGAAAAAPNLEGLLNGPRGLDARSAKRLLLSGARPAAVELRLPFALADFGEVRGIVRDADGAPLPSVAVSSGFRQVHSDARGRFSLPRLPAGSLRVSAQRYGYRPESRDLELRGGETVQVEFELAFAESGSLTLGGAVVGPGGEPVPGATVYVMAAVGNGTGTIRTLQADAAGQFSMENLPDRLRDVEVRLQANATGYKGGTMVLDRGWPGGTVTLRLPERLVHLTLRVVNGVTGEPLDRCRLSTRGSGGEEWRCFLSSYTDAGAVTAWLPAGRTDLLVEAPDHESQVATLDLDPPGSEVLHTVRLIPEGPPTEEVALTVRITSAATGEPVRSACVEVLPERGDDPVQRIEATRDDGAFTLPAPSGSWRLRVAANGYETLIERLDLPPEEKETTREVRLTPR